MKTVPFYENTEDDLHCFQATMKMILKYFLPKKSFTFKELDILTGQKKGYWTWNMRGELTLKDMGFEVIKIEEFDYAKVAADVKSYLKEVYGEEVAREQIQHSDITSVQNDAKEFIRKISIEYRLPDFSDIKRLLKEGYLIGCLVNSKRLNGKPGYVGHFVLVFACTETEIQFHDPGLPPQKNRTMTLSDFEKAWGFPDKKAKNILAVKL